MPVRAIANQISEVLANVFARALFGELEVIVTRVQDVSRAGAHVERVLQIQGLCDNVFERLQFFRRFHDHIPILGRDCFFASFGSSSTHSSLYFASEKNLPST